NTGSLFPMFPWSGFLCAGLLTAAWLRGSKDCKRTPLSVALAGLCFFLLGSWGRTIPVNFFGDHDVWKTSPYVFFIHLGVVITMLAVLWWVSELPSFRSHRWPFIESMGQETLFLYVTHLLVLYGTPLTLGIDALIPKSCDPLQSSIASGVFLAIL